MNRRLFLGVLNGVGSDGGVNPDISIVLTDQSILDVGGQPSVDAQGSYELRTNGIAYKANNYTGPTVIPGQWTSPTAAVGADYEAFCTIAGTNAFPDGGVMPWSAPLDEWLSLGTSRSWVVLAQGNERISTLLRVTIREAVSQEERATAEIFFDLQRALI